MEVSGRQNPLLDLQKVNEGGLGMPKAVVRPPKSKRRGLRTPKSAVGPPKSKRGRSQDAKSHCKTSKNASPPRSKPSIKQAKNIILPPHP